jgi:hypothetical protein
MKAQATIAITLFAANLAYAEPVFMPQASSVLKTNQFEAGIGGMFGYQLSELDGSPGTTYKNRVWHVPVFFRWGITDRVESRLTLPITYATDSSEGLASTRYTGKGIGNIQMSGKWQFIDVSVPVAAALDLDLPTANARNNPAPLGWRYSTQVQQGLNVHPHVVADIPLVASRLNAHAQLGYMNTGTYTAASQVRFDPSDLMTFGASVALQLEDQLPGVVLAAECVGNTALNHSTTGRMRNSGDRGTVVEAGPSLRLSRGAMNAWTGLLMDAGDPTYRAYNYRVSFGVAYRFGAAQ